jgi:hypothetical protein
MYRAECSGATSRAGSGARRARNSCRMCHTGTAFPWSGSVYVPTDRAPVDEIFPSERLNSSGESLFFILKINELERVLKLTQRCLGIFLIL